MKVQLFLRIITEKGLQKELYPLVHSVEWIKDRGLSSVLSCDIAAFSFMHVRKYVLYYRKPDMKLLRKKQTKTVNYHLCNGDVLKITIHNAPI